MLLWVEFMGLINFYWLEDKSDGALNGKALAYDSKVKMPELIGSCLVEKPKINNAK